MQIFSNLISTTRPQLDSESYTLGCMQYGTYSWDSKFSWFWEAMHDKTAKTWLLVIFSIFVLSIIWSRRLVVSHQSNLWMMFNQHFCSFFSKWLPNIRKLSQGRGDKALSEATKVASTVSHRDSKGNFKVRAECFLLSRRREIRRVLPRCLYQNCDKLVKNTQITTL